MNDNKLNILKELVVEEDHTLEDLKRLVDKSKAFIKIENKTGKIIITNEYPFIVPEKIVLFLIGVFFAKELGLYNEEQITSKIISDNINIAQTSMSGPLGNYGRMNIISSDSESYSIKYYEIENQLDYLVMKYLSGKEPIEQPIKRKKVKDSNTKKTKKSRSPKRQKKKILKTIDKDKFESELIKYSLTSDGIYSVINIVDNAIILSRGWKSSSKIESQIKSTLLYLTVNKILYDLNEVESSELRKDLLYSGVPMDNHSTNIKNFSTFIVHKRGAIGSTLTSYRITPLGYQKGITLIKDIIENTSNFDIKFKSRIRTEKAENFYVDRETLDKHIFTFAERNGVDEDKLKTLFDFQEDGVRMSRPLKEKTRKILQLKTLMLVGIILKSVYDVNGFSGIKILKDSRLTSDRLDLLDQNKHYKTFFSIKKPKSAMQLTYAGEKRAIEMLKEYVENERCSI